MALFLTFLVCLDVHSHLHVRMLECDPDPTAEGSGTMLFQTLKCLLMLIPQSACYSVLRDRLVSTSRFRQSVIPARSYDDGASLSKDTQSFVTRILDVREIHCDAMWQTIRADSLEFTFVPIDPPGRDEGTGSSERHKWLGYESKEDEQAALAQLQEQRRQTLSIEEIQPGYDDLQAIATDGEVMNFTLNGDKDETWKAYWAQSDAKE
jgi:hypothetical protein